MNKEIKYISLDKLKLDFKNPRLPIQASTENDIIEWMLADASILELMLAIGKNDFFIGEALLVIEEGDNFIVLEGNRRLTALKILHNPSLATIHKRKIEQILDETKERPVNIPCIVFEKRKDILKYLGYRHVTGIKSWGILAKAKYLTQLKEVSPKVSFKQESRELAKQIGSKSDYVVRLLTGYEIYKIIEDNNFYKIPKLDKTTFHFNYIADALRRENINLFIDINLDSDNPLEKLNNTNLKELIHWFFEKNSQNRSRVLGNNEDLTKLNQVLGDEDATNKFFNGSSLDEAIDSLEFSEDRFTRELSHSLRNLENANSFIHKLDEHNGQDIDTLKDIVKLCRIMKDTIEEKKGDNEWDI
jgi:hypothetical protein